MDLADLVSEQAIIPALAADSKKQALHELAAKASELSGNPVPAREIFDTLLQRERLGSTGLGRGNVTGVPAVSTAVICDERGNEIAAGGSSAARVLVVTPLGRATVIRDVDMIGTLIESTGATCP